MRAHLKLNEPILGIVALLPGRDRTDYGDAEGRDVRRHYLLTA